ncbi:MAG: IS3 family transposase [Bacilli bacterium]|nr:IS3 family transposase [Bacilli bacterium]
MNGLRRKYELKLLLSVSGLPKSVFYYHLKKNRTTDKDAELKDIITSIFNANNYTYGYRRIDISLRNIDIIVNHKKVLRLMKELGLHGYNKHQSKYNSYKGRIGDVAPNLYLVNVNGKSRRNFKADKPNSKYSTDITEFKIPYGKLYLSPMLDLYDSRVVTYTISTSPNFMMIKEMLNKTLNIKNEFNDLIIHSDQGWHYQMREYQQTLKDNGITQSMSRKGNCLDNSPIENFFGILKKEIFIGHEKDFKSLKELEKKIIEYINYYNNFRISLKHKMTPMQYHNLYYNNVN